MTKAAQQLNDDQLAPPSISEGANTNVAGARLRRLTMTDFRSYARTDIAFDGRPVVLTGPNGAGKTNILEAISLLGPGRGVRGSRLDELPRLAGDGGWAVVARLEERGETRKFGVGAVASKPDRRVCRIDERAATGPSAFVEHLRFLWLTPAQDRLFMEGAGERRRFLDRMALAHNPEHGRASSDYEQAMRQRQKLLEAGGRDDAWLTALEMQMAEAGVVIAAGRRDTATRLAAENIAGENCSGAIDMDGFFPAADIALAGDIEAELEATPAAEVEEGFAARLRARRSTDKEAGRALLGPHRSDLLVSHRAKARPARLCSTGEQKALLIGLVLANARSLSAKTAVNKAPLILLLDEIAAHLDEDRRAKLFDILDDLKFQTFMTGTDQSLFSAWGERAQSFNVANGAVEEIAS